MREINKDAITIVAEALMIAPNQVNENTSLGETSQWDSLAHMRIILAIEEKLGTLLSPEDIIAIANIEDVDRLLD